MTIAIFRLPQVVLTELVDVLFPEEIFILSLCSQKSFQTLQSTIRKSTKLNIQLRVTDGNIMIGYNANGRKGRFMHVLNTTQCYFPFLERATFGHNRALIDYNITHKTWNTYWVCAIDGMKLVMDHITSLYCRDIHSVEIYRISYNFDALVLDWIDSRQNSLSYLYFPYICSQNYQKILNWKSVDHLETELYIPTDLPAYEHGFGARKSVYFKNAGWITVRHLMKMDQVEIILEDSEFKNSSVRKFLKNWILERGNPRLRLLQVETSASFDLEKVLRSFGKFMVEGVAVREYTSQRDMAYHYSITGGQELRRPDGATVVLQWYGMLTMFFYPPRSD